MIWKTLKAIWSGIVTVCGWIKAFFVGLWKATTWPARAAYAKASASKLGLQIWAWSIDPPAIRGIWIVIVLVLLPLIGAAVDRGWIRGDERATAMRLESRVASLGTLNTTCLAERNGWQARAETAEEKYASLMKKEPEACVPAAAAPAPAKKRPRKVKATDKPWYEKL